MGSVWLALSIVIEYIFYSINVISGPGTVISTQIYVFLFSFFISFIHLLVFFSVNNSILLGYLCNFPSRFQAPSNNRLSAFLFSLFVNQNVTKCDCNRTKQKHQKPLLWLEHFVFIFNLHGIKTKCILHCKWFGRFSNPGIYIWNRNGCFGDRWYYPIEQI